MNRVLVLIAVAATTAMGQGALSPAAKTSSSSASMEREIAGLQQTIKELRDEVDNLSKVFSNYDNRIINLEHASVDFDPSHPGPYGRADTDVGPLLISIRKAEPYLNGYKVELEIGNPLNVSFLGFKISAIWAKRYTEGKRAQWYQSRKKKEFSFTETLLPGRWNSRPRGDPKPES